MVCWSSAGLGGWGVLVSEGEGLLAGLGGLKVGVGWLRWSACRVGLGREVVLVLEGGGRWLDSGWL